MSAPTPRPYQVKGLDATAEALKVGTNRILLKAPTGTGKTVMFAAMLQHPPLRTWLSAFPRGHRRMLVVAHREELLDQAAEKIHRANPDLVVGIEQGPRYAPHGADVVIASVATLAARRYFRLKRLMTQGTFRLVIVDEAHHAAARTYRGVLAHLGFLPLETEVEPDNAEAATAEDVAQMEKLLRGWDARAPKDRLLVGVTATPNRSDAIGLGCVFQSIAFSYGLRDAIADGWLVPITAWAIGTQDHLDNVRTTAGEFNQKDLAAAVNNARRNEIAVAAWLEHGFGRQTIAFTVDVAHAHDLAAAFQRHGVDAVAVSGDTPKEERRSILQAYRDGEHQVVCNCMILTEGTDLPETSCILHAKPTKSPTLYEQMTGRGLRLHPKDPAGPVRLALAQDESRFIKRDCVVIDLADLSRKHSLQTAPVLYGLPPKLKGDGKKLEQMAEAWDELREKRPAIDPDEIFGEGGLTLADFEHEAARVDVFAVQDLGAFAKGRSLQWMRVDADTFRTRYPWEAGHETVTVTKDLLGHWEVVLSYRAAGEDAATRRVLAAQVMTSDAAASLAEGFIESERSSVVRMKAIDAPWKKRPATEKQLFLLRKFRAPFRKDITAGEASLIIDTIFARKGR